MTLAAAVLLLSQTASQGSSPVADTGPRIEVRAESLGKALPEIGEKLGVPMRAAPAIAGELVLVSFASRDATAFRDQLAKAFSGEWRQDENGIWYFTRSASMRAAERKAAYAKRIEKLAKVTAKSRAASKPDEPFSAAAAEGLAKDLKKFTELPKPREDQYDAAYYRRARGLDQRGPSNRVIQRIMAKIPVAALDTDPESGPQRFVYSTRPTKMQRPMPFDVMPDLRQYMQEQNAWSQAMSESGIPEEYNGGYTSLMYRRQRADKQPAVALLIIQDRWGSRQISLKAYDADGRSIMEESQYLSNYDEDESEALQKKMKDNPRKVPFAISPESKRFAEVFDFNEERRKKNGITNADAAPYMDVVARDPMSYGASEIMFAVARGESRNLISRVDDTYFYLSYSMAEPEVAKDGKIDATFLDYYVNSTEENGWTRFTPKDIQQSAKTTYDRKMLAQTLAIAAQPGRMTVERQAEMALAMPENPEQMPMYSLVRMLSGNRYYGADEFLKLYGQMTPAQRKIAQGEQGVPFSSLSQAAIATIEKLAYQSDEWRLQYSPTPEYNKQFKDGQDPNQEMFWGGYLREPTFSLPDGLKNTGRIKLTIDTQDKVKTGSVTQRWGNQDGETMTVDDLAQNWFQSANPRRFPWAQDEWSRKNFDAMTLVNQQSVNMEVRFDERITASNTMTSDIPIEGGPYTMKTLPKSFLDAFQAAVKKLEEQYKDQPLPDPNDYRPYQRGGGAPPPAR